MALKKVKGKYYQLAYRNKKGWYYPEREIKPKNHQGTTKYRYQLRWLSKRQMDEICQQD